MTDFLVFDLPAVRDRLARDFEGSTLATGDPDVRVYVGVGALVPFFAVFAVLDGGAGEAFWITIDQGGLAAG